MTSNFNKELDLALRTFIQEPDNFLDSLALVNSLHSFPVLASKEPYAIAIEGQKLVPVFTDQEDLRRFKEQQASAQKEEWVERPSLDVLQEAILHQLEGLIYNVKKTGDFANTTVFKTAEMIDFITSYSTIINAIFHEDNQAADILDKTYFVPVFIHPKKKDNFRAVFPTMSKGKDESFIPVFTTLPSFAKWYSNEEFGLPFRQAKGAVLAWKMTDIKQAQANQAQPQETKGLVINPFDDEQIAVEWSALEK